MANDNVSNLPQVKVYGVNKPYIGSGAPTLAEAEVLKVGEKQLVLASTDRAFGFRLRLPKDQADFTPAAAFVRAIEKQQQEIQNLQDRLETARQDMKKLLQFATATVGADNLPRLL